MIFLDENKLPCSELERKIFWLFVKSFFDAVVNTAFYVSRVNFFGNFLWKNMFFSTILDNERNFLGFEEKVFSPLGCQNCILHVHRSSLMENDFFSKKFMFYYPFRKVVQKIFRVVKFES